ncbi:LppP/LprE family lipoprotein [Nocardia sp. NPDC055321]
MKRIVGIVAAVAALALTTACQDDVTSQPQPSAPGSTVATQPGGSAPGGSGSGGGGSEPGTTSPAGNKAPATAGHGLCLDVNSGVVNAALQKLGPGVGGENYTVESGTDAALGECPDLLWALAGTPRGTASSPWHVLLFNHDGYLGTATKKATSYTSVVGSGDRTVQVQYRWLTGDDANCCPSGGPTVITLTLGSDGRTITPDQDFPAEVTAPR